MTVGDLKKALEAVEDHLFVVLAKDSEGNSYSPLADTAVGAYEPSTTWYGEFWPEEDAPRRFPVNALCLGPVN